MNKKLVNCIIPVYNVGRYLVDAVDSITHQTIGFDNINLVIINDGSTDNSQEVIESLRFLYPSIVVITQENQGVSAARNAGLDFCFENFSAPYTCFIDGDDKYDPNHLETLIAFFKQYEKMDEEFEILDEQVIPDAVFIPIRTFEKQEGLHYSYKAVDRGKSGVLDMSRSFAFFSHVNSGLFVSQALEVVRFNEKMTISEDADFILKIINKKHIVGWYNDKLYYYLRKRLDESSTIDNAENNSDFYNRISYYKQEFEVFVQKLGQVPRENQVSRLYDLHWFKSNKPINNENNFDLDEALENIRYILQQVDDDLLEQKYIPYWYQIYFKSLKYGQIHLRNAVNEIEPRFQIADEVIENLDGNAQINWINQREKQLQIRGFYVRPMINEVKLVAKYRGEFIEGVLNKSKHDDLKYYLGREIFPAVDFEFNINLAGMLNQELQSIEFYFNYHDKYAAAHLVHGWNSRFYWKNDFFIGEEAIIKKSWSSHALVVEKLTKHSLNNTVLSRKKNYKDNFLFERYVDYFESYRNKRIWLFIDRPTTIGDNAEALFRYCANREDGIEKFMIIPDETYYQNFEGVSANIIIYGSFEYKFLLMFAEKVISSTTFWEWVNIDTNIPKYEFKLIVQALSNAQEVFLQHGIIRKTSFSDWYLNSSSKNFDFMITSTEKEYELMRSEDTGFKEKQVQLTGLPRFDFLKNHAENVITFLPTWRIQYSKDDGSYDKHFKESDFFKSINEFLNDENLLELLRKNNYRFIFKIHPKFFVQIEDFDIPEEIEIVSTELSYNEIYEKSAILITDYSSAVVDFAYLKKPIIYYHSIKEEDEENPEYFSYERDGFGEICLSIESVINKVQHYIDNDCLMEEEYVKRVDSFFKYTDKNNSERVYDEILRLPIPNKNKII
ncbi:bifunctional glycosyltransferase/CDP-glycerol:glycerophosphate glycerophosphotransferase [Lactococcus lactis]|uniref:bifunctional glycosyltransferase/CDP-glycerol:glycerophosphate glycerophosphotransferase n=1 Tax=Lactococcus lactis TaxID=1358 RepID=UPI0021A4F975|nr:CDP-glycerol:glycerophosphate glycerophosphotransferase [Lactococcus lactis]MCT3132410.1 glycosyltransferase [Lactococcus lactis]